MLEGRRRVSLEGKRRILFIRVQSLVLVWALLLRASVAFLAISLRRDTTPNAIPRARTLQTPQVVASTTKEAANWNKRWTSKKPHGQGVKRRRGKRPSRDEKEFQWLTWLHRSWKDVPAGEVDAVVVKQIPTALSLYSKRQTVQAAQQSEEMLRRYVDEYLAGNRAIEVINTASFHATMNAYAKCGQPHPAQTVLRYMLELADSHPTRLGHLKPDVFSFTILATAWSKSRHAQAADKAEALLRYMEAQHMPITTLTYNVVLNAIVVSHDKNKATRAQAVVEKMIKKSNQHSPLEQDANKNCAPDLYTYQTWMSACSRTRGGLEQTLKIFKFLDDKKNSNDDNNDDEGLLLRPNAHCFAAAIHAWAHANAEPDRARQAYLLLQEMRKRYEEQGQKDCKPNVVVYTAAINTCVVNPIINKEQEQTEESFEIAQLIFEELLYSPYATPNFLSYAAFLRVCSSTLPEDSELRDSVVRRVFTMSCKEGHVGKMVLQQFKEAASNELYREVMADINDYDDMPGSWRCRVKGERYEGPSSPTFSRGTD